MASSPNDQLGLVRRLREQNANLENEVRSLKDGTTGGTSPPVAEDNLKGRVDLLQTLVVIFITALLALAFGVMTAIGGANTRIDGVQETSSALNREVGTLTTKADETNRRLERIEQKIDALGAAK